MRCWEENIFSHQHTVQKMFTCRRWFDEVHDDWIRSFGVDSDLVSEWMLNHHGHALACWIKAKRVQQLKRKLSQVRKLHHHLVRQTAHQRALVCPRSVHESGLVRRLGFVAQLALLLRQPPVCLCSIHGGWDGAEGMVQGTGCVGVCVGVGSALLVQLGERALCRRRGEDAGAAAVGGWAVGDQAGQAAAVGAGRQTAGCKALDEILDGLHRGLQLKPPHLQKDQRQTSVTLRTIPENTGDWYCTL